MKHIAHWILGIALTAAAVPASATTILFYDDFNRNNTEVGNGWTDLEDSFDDVEAVNPASGTDFLKLEGSQSGLDAAAKSPIVDAVGYAGLQLTFRWQALSSNESSDRLYAAASATAEPSPPIDGSGWLTVADLGAADTNWQTSTTNLSGFFDDKMFSLLFYTDVSASLFASSEGFRIDYVQVTGTQIYTPPPPRPEPMTPVPLPAGGALLIGGLAAFGLMRRTRG